MVENKEYKELLRQRMVMAIASSIVIQLFLTCCTIFILNVNLIQPLHWVCSTWSIIVSFRMFYCSTLFTVIIIVQNFIQRRSYMQPPSYWKNRFVKICDMFSPYNVMVCGLYIFTGGIWVWLHLSLEGGKYGSVVKNCKSTLGHYCLVEEHCYLLLAGYWAGFYFVMKTKLLDDQQQLQFPLIPLTKVSQIRKGIFAILPNAMINAFWSSLYFLGIYYIFGIYCRSIITSFVSVIVEDEPLNKVSRLLDPSLLLHSWLYTLLFILSINSTHVLCQVYLTEWIPFEIEQSGFGTQEASTKTCLMKALSMDTVPIIQHLGYLDLVTLAQKDRLRRNILFALSQPGGHPYNWNFVVDKCLSIIKHFTENINSACLVRKELPLLVQQQQVTINLNVATSISEKRPFVYNMRNLASSPTESVLPQSTIVESKDAFTQNVVPGEQTILHYLNIMKHSVTSYLLSKPLIYYVFGEQVESKIRHTLLNSLPVIWAADAVSSLSAISITEDPYGIVQKDLPSVIETLLSIKEALDKLQKTNVLIKKPISEDKFVRHTLTALRSAIKRSIYRIVATFANYIDELGLSANAVNQLQPYFSYRE